MTAEAPRRMARARASAGPLLRVLGLAVVLFAVVLMHGPTPGNLGEHVVTSVATPATAAPEHRLHGVDALSVATVAVVAERFVGPRGGHGDHGSGHPAEHCASAQPQQGPALAQPRFAASVSEVAAPGCAPTVRNVGEPRLSDQSSAALRALVVQQV